MMLRMKKSIKKIKMDTATRRRVEFMWIYVPYENVFPINLFMVHLHKGMGVVAIITSVEQIIFLF